MTPAPTETEESRDDNGILRVGPRRVRSVAWPPPWLAPADPTPAEPAVEAPTKPTKPNPEPPVVDPPTIPDRSFWRSRLAAWPDDWRRRWGELANTLIDANPNPGMTWREAEWRAFREISEARHEAAGR